MDLARRTCTCREWDVLLVPCRYACVTVNFMEQAAYGYCNRYMTVEAFKASYKSVLCSVPNYDKSKVTYATIQIHPPSSKRCKQKMRQINNHTEYTRPLKCFKYHKEAYNVLHATPPVKTRLATFCV